MATRIILESTPARSLAKGFTWETSGVVTLLAVALFFSHDLGLSFVISLAWFPIRVAMYFGHERIWKRIPWGHREHIVTSGRVAGERRRPIRWTGKTP